MRLGLGLYRYMLNDAHYRFARQCGATDIIVHLCDYGVKTDPGSGRVDQPIGERRQGWGVADHPGLWTLDELLAIRRDLERNDLRFHGVENFDPAQWHDVLLAGPRRDEQLEQACRQIEIFADAGIEVFGYNFSLGGVTGRAHLRTRGDAGAVGLDGADTPDLNEPIPKGMIWNMVYDPDAPPGVEPTITHEELWNRLAVFLRAVLPTAERRGIRLSAHPDDPPLPMVRRQPRLVHRHALYQKLIDIDPSPANALEFCVGTLAEMADDDLYGCVERYARQGRIGYVHLRNVRGRVPHYCETFIDEGDVDIARVFAILRDCDYKGVIIPDHAPQMTCAAPWHAGTAFAMGYLKAQLDHFQGAKP